MPKQVIKLEAIGFQARDAGLSTLRMASSLGCLDVFSRRRNPGVWRITGVGLSGHLLKTRLRADVDYSEANSVGSRGVYFYYVLDDGGIYEVFEWLSWKSSRTYYCRAVDGRREHLNMEQVLRWLES